jgi:hypothetical protein
MRRNKPPMRQRETALTFNQLSPLRPLLQALLQVVRRALPLELQLSSLQGRRGVCVEQNVAVLEVFFVGTCLQVLLEAVAAVGGGDRRDVDALGERGRGDGRSALGHGCGIVQGYVWFYEVGVFAVGVLRGRSMVLCCVKKRSLGAKVR